MQSKKDSTFYIAANPVIFGQDTPIIRRQTSPGKFVSFLITNNQRSVVAST